MGIVKTILFVAFVIISILLILMVLIQNEDNNGMGGVFGGGQSAAFGAHSASVLSKATGIFTALFFVLTFGLALLNKTSDRAADLGKTAVQEQESNVDSSVEFGSWLDNLDSETK